MVKVQFGDVFAEIENQTWQCEDETLCTALTSMLPMYGVSPSDPHPDLTVAQDAAHTLGGMVVDEGEPPDYLSGVVY